MVYRFSGCAREQRPVQPPAGCEEEWITFYASATRAGWAPKQEAWTVARCIAEYVRHNAVPVADVKLLDTLRPTVTMLSTRNLNYDWAEAWIAQMKRVQHLAPSTIRHQHGALARCFDWMLRKHPDIMAQNPLRLLKRGFSTYTDEDAAILAAAGK